MPTNLFRALTAAWHHYLKKSPEDKLKALAAGAALVRNELNGTHATDAELEFA